MKPLIICYLAKHIKQRSLLKIIFFDVDVEFLADYISLNVYYFKKLKV